MPSDRLPSFGDVITSTKFRYGRLNYDGKPPIQVGQDSPNHIVSRYLTEDEMVKIAKIVGGKPERPMSIDYGVPDHSRATAEFVVVDGRMEGGGSCGTPMGHDDYPDGWHIVAKRLNKDGKWNPNGEVIAFYMTGCFIDMIPPEEVTVVRHMEMHYV